MQKHQILLEGKGHKGFRCFCNSVKRIFAKVVDKQYYTAYSIRQKIALHNERRREYGI